MIARDPSIRITWKEICAMRGLPPDTTQPVGVQLTVSGDVDVYYRDTNPKGAVPERTSPND